MRTAGAQRLFDPLSLRCLDSAVLHLLDHASWTSCISYSDFLLLPFVCRRILQHDGQVLAVPPRHLLLDSPRLGRRKLTTKWHTRA